MVGIISSRSFRPEIQKSQASYVPWCRANVLGCSTGVRIREIGPISGDRPVDPFQAFA